MENYTEPLQSSYNVAVGGIVAVLSYIFGELWWLFAAFFLMNIIDEITGWYKAYILHKESSEVGWKGVLKKLCYWLMIAVSFVMGYVFIKIGEVLNVDLRITQLLGWFVLASLFVNEIRSILENLVQAGVYVPFVLKKGLEVADEMLKAAEDVMDGPDSHE